MSLQTRWKRLPSPHFPIQVIPYALSFRRNSPSCQRTPEQTWFEKDTEAGLHPVDCQLCCETFNVRPKLFWKLVLKATRRHSLQPGPFPSTGRKHHARFNFASGAQHVLYLGVQTTRSFLHWTQDGLRQHRHEINHCFLASYHDNAARLREHLDLTSRQASPGI